MNELYPAPLVLPLFAQISALGFTLLGFSRRCNLPILLLEKRARGVVVLLGVPSRNGSYCTTTAWLVNLVAEVLYAVLGAVAQFERDVMRERTVAGLVAAKGRGERLGRRPALSPVQRREAQIMLDRGENIAHVARALRVGRSTIYRAIAT